MRDAHPPSSWISIPVVLVLSLGASVAADTIDAAGDPWPMQPGNHWTYKVVREGNEREEAIEVEATRMAWARLGGFPGNPWLASGSGPRKVFLWDAGSVSRKLLFDLSLDVGGSFRSSAPGIACLDGADYEVIAKGVEVTTPAGSFDDAIEIRLRNDPCSDAGWTRLVFAPGIGPVVFDRATLGGTETASLVRARVDGTTYPPPAEPIDPTTGAPRRSGLIVALVLDRYEYESFEDRPNPDSPAPPEVRPARMTVRFTIANGTDEPIEFTHPSGQQYEFTVRDAEGNEVRRWPSGAMFAQVIRPRTLEPGDRIDVEKDLELAGEKGRPLPSGEYVFVATHTTTPRALQAAAKVPFRIELQITP